MKKEYKLKCYAGDEPRIKVTEDFVLKNHLKIDSQEAFKIMKEESLLGFEHEIACDFLTFKLGKEFFKEEFIKEIESKKKKFTYISDVYEATQDFLDYMVFAWMKARDQRGISASRSIMKLSTWMRILGRKDVADILNDEKLYAPYGIPALKKACEVLGVNFPNNL